MKPIPGMEGAFPFIGNALQFKANAGGKHLVTVCLFPYRTEFHCCMQYKEMVHRIFYVCMLFKDFFNQIIEGTNENRHRPLVKVWVGPIPFLVLFHAETIEVCIITVIVTIPALLATKCDDSCLLGHSM